MLSPDGEMLAFISEDIFSDIDNMSDCWAFTSVIVARLIQLESISRMLEPFPVKAAMGTGGPFSMNVAEKLVTGEVPVKTTLSM